MDFLLEILPYFHRDIALPLEAYSRKRELCEVRLGIGLPVVVCDNSGMGVLLDSQHNTVIADKNRFEYTLRTLTGGSPYSISQSLINGFVTIGGGHRVGVCGTMVADSTGIKNIRDICFLCFRICREVRGCAQNLAYAICENGRIQNTLIASLPGYGKTTILRDLCRIFAGNRSPCGIKRVGIADERGEIAAMNSGVSNFEIGYGSFVCTGYSKKHAFVSMMRSMSPDVMVTDEIGTSEDFDAVCEAIRCGVSIIASVHAGDIHDLRTRFGDKLHCFETIIFPGNKNSTFNSYRRCRGDY